MTPANHDLRAWLNEVDKIGQLRRVSGIPWDKDMGGLVEMILERNKHAPAMLFENIPGARQDMSILCSQIDGIERLALAMGTDPKDATRYEWREKFPAVNAVSDDFKAELDQKYAALLGEIIGRAH